MLLFAAKATHVVPDLSKATHCISVDSSARIMQTFRMAFRQKFSSQVAVAGSLKALVPRKQFAEIL